MGSKIVCLPDFSNAKLINRTRPKSNKQEHGENLHWVLHRCGSYVIASWRDADVSSCSDRARRQRGSIFEPNKLHVRTPTYLSTCVRERTCRGLWFQKNESMRTKGRERERKRRSVFLFISLRRWAKQIFVSCKGDILVKYQGKRGLRVTNGILRKLSARHLEYYLILIMDEVNKR